MFEGEFADRVEAAFDAHKHKTLATLRKDGSPRISGTEARFRGNGYIDRGNISIALRLIPRAIKSLAELNLPGVLTPNPALLEQAGRNWLVTRAAAVPTLADVLEDGAHREPGNAAALLSDVAATLLTTHRAGLAHGALDARSVLVGQDGAALLTDWGTNTAASAAADVTAWTLLAELLAEHWCADDLVSAAALARAVHAANGPTGLAGGFDQLRGLANAARRDTLAQAAKDELDAVGRGEVRPPRRPQSRRAQPAPPAPTEPPVAAAAVPPMPAEPVEPPVPQVPAVLAGPAHLAGVAAEPGDVPVRMPGPDDSFGGQHVSRRPIRTNPAARAAAAYRQNTPSPAHGWRLCAWWPTV